MTRKVIALLACLGSALLCTGQSAAQSARAEEINRSAGVCGQDNGFALICSQHETEDLTRLGHTPWVLGSWIRANGLIAFDIRNKSIRPVFPAENATIAWDKKTYPDCPAAPGAGDKDIFPLAGLSVSPLGGQRYRVLAVRMPPHSAIHVFDIVVGAKGPVAAWRGCVPAPDAAYLNSVVALPEGGFAATKFIETGAREEPTRQAMLRGEVTGHVMEWHAGKGWSILPGADLSGNNGILLSHDRKWFYVNAWGGQAVHRFARKGGERGHLSIPTGFHMDNLRWAEDGSILATGHGNDRTLVIRLDPRTFTFKTLLDKTDTDAFKRGTVAIEVDKDIWVGTSRAPHLLVLPRK